jgi:Glucan phosphorylase
MRHSIAELGTQFSTTRMVREYVERLYLPAHDTRSRIDRAA